MSSPGYLDRSASENLAATGSGKWLYRKGTKKYNSAPDHCQQLLIKGKSLMLSRIWFHQTFNQSWLAKPGCNINKRSIT